MLLRFIHVVVCIESTFLFIAEWYSISWIYLNLFIRSLVDVPMGCLWLLAILNKAAMNIDVHVFGWTYIFTSW